MPKYSFSIRLIADYGERKKVFREILMDRQEYFELLLNVSSEKLFILENEK